MLTQWAVCAAWCDALLPGPLQEALRQHLQQHAFSTATAPATLARLIQLSPSDMSTNTQAVITGWQSPGSPLLELTATPQVGGHGATHTLCSCQYGVDLLAVHLGLVLNCKVGDCCAACALACMQGLQLRQRRFCSWGLLGDSFLASLPSNAGSDATPAQPPTPPAATSSSSSSAPLLCPSATEGQERAVPWTPVYVALLPDFSSTAASDGSNGTAGTIGSSKMVCGQWVVVQHEESSVPLPAGCAQGQPTGPGYILEGDGGWGVYRSLYPAAQRAGLRAWVVSFVKQAGVEAAAAGSSMQLPPGLLLVASKVLQDQAALSLSAFGEVPGVELWEVLHTAVQAALAASTLRSSNRTEDAGFGTVLFSLLSPVLPVVEVLVDRLAGDKGCWVQQQVSRTVPRRLRQQPGLGCMLCCDGWLDQLAAVTVSTD